jgi:cell division protein FtsW
VSSYEEVVSLQAQRALRRAVTPASASTRREQAVPRSSLRPLRPSAIGFSAPKARDRPWPKVATMLVVLVGALTMVGLLFILSASSVESINRNGSYLTIFAKQVWWEVLGLAALFISQRLGVRAVERWWAHGWVTCLTLLIAVDFVGIKRHGSRRWLSIGGFELQPSEMAKFAIIVSLAHVLTLRRRTPGALGTLGPIALFSVPLIACVLIQPDLGTTIVITLAGLAVLLAGGVRWKYLGCIVGLLIVGGSLSVMRNDYQYQRVVAFRDINDKSAYHIRESIESIQSGGATGVGVGAGRSKYGYIPNSHTDFIYSVISEETGSAGATLVLGLFAAFAWVGTLIALRASDAFSRLIAFGITAWISVQALGNVAAVTAMAPVTGIPIPFVSQGGTSFVTLMVAVGVLLDIARRGQDPQRVRQP